MTRDEEFRHEETNAHRNPQARSATSDPSREPFPPSPPVLEEHPFIRILRYQGFSEHDFDPAKRVSVPLTQAEIRTLAQHHLDNVYRFRGFMKTGGSFGSSDLYRDAYHRERYGNLAELLSQEDQAKFQEIQRIRNEYIETLRDTEDDPY